MNDKFVKWKAQNLLKPFSDDQEFFRENYGMVLTPFLKDLFSELLAIDARLAMLENRDDDE